MSLRPAENRFTACEKLLKSGANGDEVDKALTVVVSDESRDTSFLKIIIPNADINYNGGEALSLAVKRNLSEHALILLEQVPDITSFNNAFEAAMSLDESLNQLKFCRMLLEAPAPEQSASSALLKAVRSGRYDLCKLMLQLNDSPDFNGGSCLITAVHDKNIKILVLLVESGNPKASKDSLEAAFKAALSITDRKAGLELVQILLDAGVGGQPLHTALIAQSKRGDQSLALCEILLKYGASINASQGEALNNAAKLGATLLLQNMLQGRKVEEACLIRLVP
jgi:ankyrin repeat protein